MIFSYKPEPFDDDGLNTDELLARVRAFLKAAQAASHDDPPRSEKKTPEHQQNVDEFFRKAAESVKANQGEQSAAQPEPVKPPLCARCGAALAMPDVLPDDEPGRLCLACWRLSVGRAAVQSGHYTDWPGSRQPGPLLLLPGHCVAQFEQIIWRGLHRPNPWDSYGREMGDE